LVYAAVVEHAHPTQGKLFVKVQNGYEMDELHNVSAQSPSNGQTLIYNTSTSLWEKANLTAGTGISVSNGAGSITVNNTGVTSVSVTSPVASTGGTTPTISLAASYGDTQNPYASKTANYVLAAPNGASGVPTFRAIVAADIPTLNQNTTGTASNVTGTVAIANGGSGQTTAQLAMNAFAGAVTSGSYLRGNGTNVVMNTIQAADVPTLNQNTTGSAATVTTTISSGAVATTQSAGDNSTKVATTAYVNAITGTSGITGLKNRIINGAMVIDQRNAGASVTANDGVYTVDRFVYSMSASSKGTSQQSTTTATGFTNSVLFTSSSAYTVGAAEHFSLVQKIEGFNVSDLGWGSANAQTVTLSFWVRSSLTGTFGGSISNSALNRSYPFTFTISSANTFEQKTITIVGDTTGTWVTNSGVGMWIFFNLGCGSTNSGTAGAWAGATYFSATGATSVVGTNNATFYITGVQLEKGSTATSFDYRPYGTELALCQRYCFLPSSDTSGCAYNTTTFYSQLKFPVVMRASPTSTYSAAAGYSVFINNAGTAPSAVSTDSAFVDGILIKATGTYTTGMSGFFRQGSTVYSAEL